MKAHRNLRSPFAPTAFLALLLAAVILGKGSTMAEDTPAPEPVGEFARPEGHTVGDVFFTPDGTHLVGTGQDRRTRQGVIHFWEVKSRKLVRTLTQPDTVAAAVFTPDGKRLLTAGWDNKLRLYSLDEQKLEHTFDHDPPKQTANYLAMFPDGKRFVSGNVGYQGPRIWDLEKRSAIRLAAPPEAAPEAALRETIRGVAVSKDGKRFAVAYDTLAEVWDAEKLKVVGRLKMEVEETEGRQGVVTSIALSPDGKTLATGCITVEGNPGKRAVRIWDARTFRLLHESEALQISPIRIAYTPDSKLIVTNVGARQDEPRPGIVYVWEAATGKRVLRFQSSKYGGMHSALSPDGRWLVTCDEDCRLRLWDFAKIRKDIGR